MQIYVIKAGQETGPFSKEQLQSMLKAGMIALNDLAWRNGLPTWIPLHQIVHLNLTTSPVAQPAYAVQNRRVILKLDQLNGQTAGFGIRLLAMIVDVFVGALLGWAVFLLLVFMLSYGGKTPPSFLFSFYYVFGFFFGWLYHALFESSSMQATLGKRLCELVVTNEQGQRIGFGRATGRYFGKYLSSFILCIGYLMCLWTEKRQCLHDMMASCLILQK